jgi:hypothetical protein
MMHGTAGRHLNYMHQVYYVVRKQTQQLLAGEWHVQLVADCNCSCTHVKASGPNQASVNVFGHQP